jgi:purine-nucleoside phosphorylase
MATPHINANIGDFANTVLMPGDPLRSKYIAENFLQNSRIVNNVRNVCGYTGTYKGKPVSVMASGMGMPSMAIYSYELYKYFNVENIIRIGSAGAISENVSLYDIVIAQSASTDSNYQSHLINNGVFSPCASFDLLIKAYEYLSENNLHHHVGNVLSTDVFYGNDLTKWQALNVLAVEMETAALYTNAAVANKKALSILTVSDCPLREEKELSSEERETGFNQMIEIALNVAIKD